MKALRVTGNSGLEDLRSEEIEAPGTLGDREVLIDVAAAGLNFADLLMLTGQYQDTPPVPFTPGMELSGTVSAVGPHVDGVFVGDRVAAFTGSGAFAEKAVVRDSACMTLPPSMGLKTAAAFPIAYGTAHVALTHRARLRPGDLLLVTGAGGGVGLAAVEIGKALGAEVVAAAGSAEKLDLAKSRGADHLINYRDEDLKSRLKEIASADGRAGVDVAFDPVGGDTFNAALRAIAPEGRLIVVGFASGTVQKIPANILLVKNCDVIGFYWGAYGRTDPDVHRHSFKALAAMYEAGQLKPHIGGSFGLDDAAEAYRRLQDRAAEGKLILTTGAGQ